MLRTMASCLTSYWSNLRSLCFCLHWRVRRRAVLPALGTIQAIRHPLSFLCLFDTRNGPFVFSLVPYALFRLWIVLNSSLLPDICYLLLFLVLGLPAMPSIWLECSLLCPKRPGFLYVALAILGRPACHALRISHVHILAGHVSVFCCS
jgi:hypothetical protein